MQPHTERRPALGHDRDARSAVRLRRPCAAWQLSAESEDRGLGGCALQPLRGCEQRQRGGLVEGLSEALPLRLHPLPARPARRSRQGALSLRQLDRRQHATAVLHGLHHRPQMGARRGDMGQCLCGVLRQGRPKQESGVGRMENESANHGLHAPPAFDLRQDVRWRIHPYATHLWMA